MATRLLPLALLFLLCAAAPTAAAVETPVGDHPILALEDEELEAEGAAEEEEEAEEECEEVEEGFEECKEVEAGPRADARASAEECVLRSARGHASLDPKGKKLKLTIGYTAYEPAKARIKLGNLGTLLRPLGRSGVLRVTKKLGAKRVKRLVVSIDIPSAKRAGCPSRRLVLFPR